MQVLAYHVQYLHSTLQYFPHNVACISREWSRVRPSKSSSGSYQELGQRSWSAAGAPDWNASPSIALNADEQFHRTTLEGTGLVPREAYAVCLPVSSIPLTLLSSWIGIPYDAAGTLELWGGCCTFLLCKSERVSNSPYSPIIIRLKRASLFTPCTVDHSLRDILSPCAP